MNMRPFGAEICVLVKLRGLKHVTNQCITTILGANLGAIGVYEHIFSHEYNRLQSVWVSRKRTISRKSFKISGLKHDSARGAAPPIRARGASPVRRRVCGAFVPQLRNVAAMGQKRLPCGQRWFNAHVRASHVGITRRTPFAQGHARGRQPGVRD